MRSKMHGPAAWAGVVALVGTAAVGVAQTSDEPAPALSASSILPTSMMAGPHYQVADQVETESYWHEFSLTSDFGPFVALGRSQLETRIDEIRAIAALHDVSRSEVFLQAAGGAIVDIGKGAASAVTKPTETIKGIGGGIKRFGVNLGRVSKRAVTKEGGADSGENAATGVANTALGVSSAMRRWAQKVGTDPYTTNTVLRNALEGIAQVDAAGSIATRIAVPVPRVVSTVSSVGDLVWSKDPEELRKLNEQRAKALGVPDQAAAAFFKNGWYTLTLQTRLVAALDAVKKPGCADYVDAASGAQSEREAWFFVESAEMLQRFHQRRPIDRLLTDSRAVVVTAGGEAVGLVPLDYVRSTRIAMDTLAEIGARAKSELGATRLGLHLTGRASERAKQEAHRIGWTITESAPAR
jgi:hypothetical protein